MYSLLMGVSPYDGARDVALLQSVAITEAPAELMQAEPSSEGRARHPHAAATTCSSLIQAELRRPKPEGC